MDFFFKKDRISQRFTDVMHSSMHEGMISWRLSVARGAALKSIWYSPGGREGNKDLDKICRRWEVIGACECQTTFSGEVSGDEPLPLLRNVSPGHHGDFCPCWSPFIFREESFPDLWQCNVSLLRSSPCSGVQPVQDSLRRTFVNTVFSSLLMAEPQIMQNWAGRSPRILQNYANDS